MKRKQWNVMLLALITLLQFVVTEQALALTRPTLGSPGSNASITSPSVTFSWSHPYNDLYEVKIKTTGGTLKHRSGRISAKSKTVNLAGIPLTYGSTYKWYVVVYANGQEDSSVDRWFTYNYRPADTAKPVFNSFGVTPSSVSIGGSFSISYSISDSGGSGLKQVELWRANDSGGAPGTWALISTRAVSGNGPVSGSFSDAPATAGAYWYGARVVDNAGNWNPEPSPRRVTVTAVSADDHGNSCSAATAVSANSTTAGTINSAGDWDYFRIEAPSSGTLTVYTTGSTDTYGFLKNSSCTDIASNDDYNGDRNFRIVQSVTAGTYYVAVRHYSSTGTGAYTLNVGFSASPPPTTVGWSDVTGYRHAETTRQRAIVAAALNGGNRPSPQSIIGSPGDRWLTDTECPPCVNGVSDGARMRAAIQDVYNYWNSSGRPSLPLASIPTAVQNTMRTHLSPTYSTSDQTLFIERIRSVFNGTVPTTNDGTLACLGIRAQCKEFADRMVKAGGGAQSSYPEYCS